ncbi:MAG: MFS transporter, partial [Acidimicrobiia bacterium]|nr:MFS transporter [Acidimicrobiia bacterium]
MTEMAPPTAAKRSRPWLIVSVAALTVLVSLGIGRSLGLFLSPVSDSLGTGREVFSLAIAVQSIIFGLPLAGMVADRIGARWVVFSSALLLAGGLFLTSRMTTVPGLFLGLAILGGLALSGTGFVVALGAVGRAIPPERQSFIFGLITASGSAGILVMAVLSQAWIGSFGWQTAMGLLAVVMVGVAGAALLLPRHEIADVDPVAAIPMVKALQRARRSRSYLLLIGGFFVCGFHVAFIGTHLPAFLEDGGLASWVAPTALGLIGLFNIGGSLVFGALGDRLRKRTLLAILYSARAVLMVAFLLVPLTTASALAFSATMGVVWLATVPLTSGIVAVIFGTQHLSTLFGFVFLGHQVGAFLGVWLGGRLFDATGSYDIVWIIAIVLGVVSAILHLPIKEQAMPID